MANRNISKLSMRLFGIPYQFPPAVDPRISTISTKIGGKFTQNIINEAPVCTIIPGEPVYLPGESTEMKISTAQALLSENGGFNTLQNLLGNNDLGRARLYDFKNNYTNYMNYVNVLCRAGAVFLDINDKITANSKSYSFQQYDWKQYRWNTDAVATLSDKTSAFKNIIFSALGLNSSPSTTSKDMRFDDDFGKESTLSEVLTNYNYVQFYVDSDVGSSESLSNETGSSTLKSALDSGAGMMKEIAFMANSGGIDATTLNEFTEGSMNALNSGISSILGDNKVNGALSRIINLSSDVLKGNNIIIPDIYQNSTYQKSYSITVHLKTPYGSKLGYYMDIFVPMMHLLALAMPRQASANSFASPFLVKAYVEGIFSCNLGIVESIQVSRVSDAWSVDGLPTEVDVQLNINDLYSDLSMSPSSSPVNFINNSSLIEYLATNCGLSLTKPNYKKKYEFMVDTMGNAVTDIPTTVKSSVSEWFFSGLNSLINFK